MNWHKNLLKLKFLMTMLSLTVLLGCGVKGDPLPPDKPTQLGRGRPTYRRATEGIKLEKHKDEEDEDETEREIKDEEPE